MEDLLTRLEKWVDYNKHDLGEFGKMIRVEYVQNFIEDERSKQKENTVAKNLQIDTDFNKDIEEAAHKAAVLFRTFGYTWHDSKVPPSYNEIYDHIKYLVDELLERDIEFIGSGRITARLMNDGESDSIEVYFDLATLHDERIK